MLAAFPLVAKKFKSLGLELRGTCDPLYLPLDRPWPRGKRKCWKFEGRLGSSRSSTVHCPSSTSPPDWRIYTTYIAGACSSINYFKPKKYILLFCLASLRRRNAKFSEYISNEVFHPTMRSIARVHSLRVSTPYPSQSSSKCKEAEVLPDLGATSSPCKLWHPPLRWGVNFIMDTARLQCQSWVLIRTLSPRHWRPCRVTLGQP